MDKVIKKKGRLYQIKKFLPFYLMGLPALVYIFINNIMPLYDCRLHSKTTELWMALQAVNGVVWIILNFCFASGAPGG